MEHTSVKPSSTTTSKAQLAVLLYASTAAQETLVRPRLKSDPDEGEHTTVLRGMLSVTFTGNTTFADDVFARVSARSVVGQASVGGSLSSTSNEHVALFVAASETTHTTVRRLTDWQSTRRGSRGRCLRRSPAR